MTKHTAAIAILISTLTCLHPAHAEEHDSDPHTSSFVFSFSPQYFGLNTDAYSGAFANNGFSAPKNGTVGLDFTFYWTMPTDWQLGLGFSALSYSNDLGANTAEYSQGIFGLWLGKSLIVTDSFELSLGGLFALGNARFEMLSGTANGRTDESAFIFEPKLTALFKVSHWFGVALSGAYLEPLAQSDTIKGQNLTPGNITIHAGKGGVEFVFGRFGEEPSK